MGNSEQKPNGGAGETKENIPSVPGPIIPAGDDSKRNVSVAARQTGGTADRMVLKNPFTGPRGAMKPALSAYDVLTACLRYKWTILAVFAGVAVPLVVAIWTQIVPEYQAKAIVRVRPIIPYLVFRTEDSGRIPLYDSYVKTQAAFIESTTVLERVLAQQTQWSKNPPESFIERLRGTSPIDRLRDALSVQPRRETEIIDVTFTDPNPADAKIILEAILREYKNYIENKVDPTQGDVDVLAQLEKQHTSLQEETKTLEDRVTFDRDLLQTADPEGLVSTKRVRLDEARARLTELERSIAALDLEIGRIDANDSNDALAAAEVQRQRRYHEDEEWRQLDINVRRIQHSIDTSRLTDKHPDMIQARKDRDFAKELLGHREAQLDEEWSDLAKDTTGRPTADTDAERRRYALQSLKDQRDQKEDERRLLAADLVTQEGEFNDLFQNAKDFETDNNQLQQKRELFDAVRRRLEQKQMERNAPGSIVVPLMATVSSTPYNDRRIELTVMVLVLALGLGGGAAYFRDSRNKIIYTPKDMPYMMQVSYLGSIPDIHGTKPSNGQALHDLIESTRVVRTALLSRMGNRGCTTVLVTSAGKGTGKSSFTLMLGKSLALAGKRVLMIDADFGQMALTGHFENLRDQSGFLQSLRRKAIYKRHIFQTETPGLNIVPAGKRSDNGAPLEEIANGAFNACISKVRNEYDIILLDSASILPLADATILSSQADATIMVEREHVSRCSEIISALSRLASADARLLGTVFVGSGPFEK